MADIPIATMRGQPVEREDARREAARLLATARCPVIAGLGTCAAGAEDAVDLARACGGVLDHSYSDALLRDLGAMREYGWIVATPLLARARADTVLLVGAGLDGFALPPRPTLDPRTERRVLRLGPENLLLKLSVLRALAAGRPVARGADPGDEMGRLAQALRAARYGVAVWSGNTMTEIEIEALCGLVSDLNAATRWAGLPLAPPNNARGVAETLAWTTGFPTRISFARGRAEHDPVRFDARRMVESGEADVAVWVQALEPGPPPWGNKVPLIVVAAPGAEYLAEPPEVMLTVGKPGVDHDAVLYDAEVGTLVAVRAQAGNDIPPVSAALGVLATQLREQRARS
jgi:formylmethanofuran dehydrogenase subunit B